MSSIAGRGPAAGRGSDPEDKAGPPALLAEVRAALDGAGIRYCELRGASRDAAGQREVDLLVDPRDLSRFEHAVTSVGIAALRTPGRGGHRHFVALEPSGTWLKLDVVTRLRYGGRARALAPAALAGCLDRRWYSGGVWRPDVADALVGLVLHCVLDKRTFKASHREAILRMCDVVVTDSALRERVAARLEATVGGALSWEALSTAVATDAWDRLIAARRAIAWELFRREPLPCSRRWLGERLLDVTRPALAATGGTGFSVALLGPDGAGKTTLARALAADPQIRARIVYMGTNTASATVRFPAPRGLDSRRAGGAGRSAAVGGAGYLHRAAEQGYRSLVAWGWRARGRFVVFDRHPHEAMADATASTAGPRLRRWLLRTLTMRPDLVLVLDAPSSILRDRRPDMDVDGLERQSARYHSLLLVLRRALLLDASGAEGNTVERAKRLIWNACGGRVTAPRAIAATAYRGPAFARLESRFASVQETEGAPSARGYSP